MKYIVYNCTQYPAGGLADRFKGLVSCYGLAKTLGRQFIINWTYPYKLNSILEPNQVDWKPRPISGTAQQYNIMDIDLYRQYEPLLASATQETFPEDISIFQTNMNFLHLFKLDFAQCFRELFTFALPRDITIAPKTLGVSCRFGGQQSDWQDIDFDKKISFERVFAQMQQIAGANNCQDYFICSDSSTFLKYCTEQGLNFKSTPNIPQHIDYPGCSKDAYEKAFEDFFLLRNCDVICYIKGGYALTAALSNGKKTVLIE